MCISFVTNLLDKYSKLTNNGYKNIICTNRKKVAKDMQATKDAVEFY